MIEVSDQPIDVTRVLSAAGDAGDGAVVLFLGRVRDHTDGKRVTQ